MIVPPAAGLVEDLQQRARRGGVQGNAVPVLLDGIAADAGQQFDSRLAPPGGGHQLDDLPSLNRRIADNLRIGLVEIPQIRTVQGHVELVERVAMQEPVPVGTGPLQQTVTAGGVLLVDPHQGPFLPTAPWPDVQPLMPIEA